MANSTNTKPTLTLFSVRGIPVQVHWSFALLLVWVAVSSKGGNAFEEVLFVIAIFFCVALHELGHALMGLVFKIGTRDIVLYPIGGVATLTDSPKPLAELFIALAGPAVNVLIMGVLYPFINLSSIEMAASEAAAVMDLDFLTRLFFANLGLVVFNMIPALPMDGGRVLRASLALLKVRSATTIAARTSQGLSILLGMFGLYTNNPLLIVIAIMVFMGAVQEHLRARTHLAAMGQHVRDIMTAVENLQTFTHGMTLSQALGVAVRSFQPVFPVMLGTSVLGIVERASLLQAGAMEQDECYISGLMQRKFLTAAPDEELAALMERMNTAETGGVVVMDQDRFAGIVMRDQLLEFLLLQDLRRTVRTQEE